MKIISISLTTALVVVIILFNQNSFARTEIDYETVIYDQNPSADLISLDKAIEKVLTKENCSNKEKADCYLVRARVLRELIFGVSPISDKKEKELNLHLERDQKFKQIHEEIKCNPSELDDYYRKRYPHHGVVFEGEVEKPICLIRREKEINKLPVIVHNKTQWVFSKEYEKDRELLSAQYDFDKKTAKILEQESCDPDQFTSIDDLTFCILDALKKITSLKKEINRILKARSAENPTFEVLVTKAQQLINERDCDAKWSSMMNEEPWWMGKILPECAANLATAMRELIFLPGNMPDDEKEELQELISSGNILPNIGDPDVCKLGLLDWHDKNSMSVFPNCMEEQLTKVRAYDLDDNEVDRDDHEKKLLQLLYYNHIEKSMAVKIGRKNNCAYKDDPKRERECVSILVGEFYSWDLNRSSIAKPKNNPQELP